jgi:quercetin dioxygenase-like cupin family protein
MSVTRRTASSFRGPKEMFTGEVWLEIAASVSRPPQDLRVLKVHFSPGARTAWHSHPTGQVLHVLDGIGRVQEKDGPLEEIRAGDTSIAAPDVWHWHGAAPGMYVTHLAISQAHPGGAEESWGPHVEDDAYGADPAEA